MSLPNQLSLLRILLTPVFVYLLFMDTSASRLASLIVFTLAALTDWYDGYWARKLGDVSMWGKFLDPLADKILVSAGFISFCILGYVAGWMVIVVVIRDFLITGLRSYAIIKGRSIATSMLAKVKTFVQFGVLYLIFICHLFLSGGYSGGMWDIIKELNLIWVLMCIITFLTIISGLQYIIENRSHLRQMGYDLYRIFVPSDI